MPDPVSPIPIDEAGIEKAIKAVHAAQAGIDSGPAKDCELCFLLANEAVSAYLEAVGARVQTRVDPIELRTLRLQRRLVTPWKPLTDTKEEQ